MNPLVHKEVRLRILKTLHIGHPEGVKEKIIFLMVNEAGIAVKEKEIASEMSYLREKGYVESDLKHSRVLKEKIWLHKITSKGIDLLEGSIPADPGINEAECDPA